MPSSPVPFAEHRLRLAPEAALDAESTRLPWPVAIAVMAGLSATLWLGIVRLAMALL